VVPVTPPAGVAGSSTTSPNAGAAATGPGAAKLRPVTNCQSRSFLAIVTGRRIARVRFYLDGRLIATVTRANRSGGRWVAVVNPSRFAGATGHRVVARIQFAAASNTRQSTQSFAFTRCGRGGLAPAFTG
jgi:hypothetical protein